MSIYNDNAGDEFKAFRIRFEYCAESATFDSECLERAEAEKFFDNNQVFIYYYEMRNLIDLTSLDFSVESDLHMAFRHQVHSKKLNLKSTTFRIHETYMHDSWWNPFGEVTSDFGDLRIEHSQE